MSTLIHDGIDLLSRVDKTYCFIKENWQH